MSAEDRLRDILHSDASAVVPSGDGLALIRERAARRRRLRVMLMPASALGVAAAVTAFVVLGPAGTQELKQGPIASSSPAPDPTTSTAMYDGPALWPFTSSKDAFDWQADPSSRPWANDPVQVAQHLVTDFLKVDGVTASGAGSRITLKLGAVELGTARLVQLGTDGPWTVVEVDGGDLTITAPVGKATISSPTRVEGQITGLHENVRLQLLTTEGKELAVTSAPAGQEAPWQGTLTWDDTSWSAGGIVGVTRSDRDGALTRIVAIPVSRMAGSALAAQTFVGLIDGRVVMLDATDGRQMSQMTYPPAGTTDSAATWAGGTLAWVRGKDTGCSTTLYRKTGSDISTVVPAGGYYLATPQLSADARRLAWVQTPCSGPGSSLVVSTVGGAKQEIELPAETQSWVLDVDSAGSVLLLTRPGCGHCATGPGGNDQVVLRRVAAGATSLTQAQRLSSDGAAGGSAESACTWVAAAFDGSDVLAGESCGDSGRLVHLNAAGERVSADAPLPRSSRFASITVHNGTVLVQAFDSDVDSDGVVGIYANGRITRYPSPASCDAETGKGCLRQPDW